LIFELVFVLTSETGLISLLIIRSVSLRKSIAVVRGIAREEQFAYKVVVE